MILKLNEQLDLKREDNSMKRWAMESMTMYEEIEISRGKSAISYDEMKKQIIHQINVVNQEIKQLQNGPI